jgi:NTP pyrophosphatase (non-canonical NTP hydrolase)
MNLTELQAELRHFAAERDWQPFHTPKNLSTALMVEAAELAEIFQWMTPEQSQVASLDPDKKARIADEVADVLLYLMQVADRCEIDIAQAATQKLERNAQKYPAVREIARVSPVNALMPGAHALVDYENVQPTEEALRALVPGVSQVWVFHGPHQKQTDRRFAGFGEAATPVPISKTGKNALDFHLAFYMGYIASRNPEASLVVVSNDKGYEPMLEHARAMGFAARQVVHAKAKPAAAKKAAAKTEASPKAKKTAAKKPAAKKAAVKKTSAPKAAPKKTTAEAPAAPQAAAKQAAPAKKTTAAKNAATKGRAPAAKPPAKGEAPAPKAKAPSSPSPQGKAAKAGPTDPATIKHLAESLRRMGSRRPTKANSLRRSLKSLLGGEATEDQVEQVLGRLMEQGIVAGSAVGVSYPLFSAPGR